MPCTLTGVDHLLHWFADEGVEAAIEHAQALVKAGDGHRLLSTRTWCCAISADSLLERLAEPDRRSRASARGK